MPAFVHVSLKHSKGRTTVELVSGPLSFAVSGSQVMHQVQTVGTSEEAVAMGDVGAGGWFLAVNRDDTNYVELRAGSGLADLIKLGPGEPCLFRLASDATLYAIANTAACDLEYLAIDP